ncbi:hypothetical protein [Paenibacillus campi]|uniref:hypothetical protein n=1 Tax=Paenibacillus campi TaxID=3106031 RepID=UPI002B0035D2|nr:hypothetical protein [Paenibacillus sp. SGZ-1014]
MKMTNLLIYATNQHIPGRLYMPYTFSSDYTTKITDFKPALKLGFVPMVGGETPGGLYVTVVRDAQDKLLTYFLLGGTTDNLNDTIINLCSDDDKIIVLGADLNNELKFAVGADLFDRQSDQLIQLPFRNKWAEITVLRKVFNFEDILKKYWEGT